MAKQNPPGRFPPVSLDSNWAPVSDPSYIPPNPQSLPPRNQQPTFRPFQGIAPTPAPLLPSDVPSSGPISDPSEYAKVYDPHHYAHSINGVFNVPIISDQTGLLITSPVGKRNMLVLRNTAAAGNIFISFGSSASAQSSIRLGPGVMVLFDVVVPQDDVYAFADTGGLSLAYTYSTIAGTPA